MHEAIVHCVEPEPTPDGNNVAKATETIREARRTYPVLAAEMDQQRVLNAKLSQLGLYAARPLERIDLERIAREGIPKIEYLREPWLARNDVALFATQPGAGKSTFAHALAHSVASGAPFLDAGATDPQSVIYIDGEAGEGMTARHALQVGPATPNLHLFSMPGISLSSAEDAASIEREIVVRRAVLLVLDTLSSTFGLRDENDAAHAAKIFGTLNRWRDRHQVAILVLHHLGKNKVDGGARSMLDRVRGSSAFSGLASVVYFGERTGDDQYLDIRCAGKARGRSGKFAARVELIEDGDQVQLRQIGEPPAVERERRQRSNPAEQAVRAFLADQPDCRAKRATVIQALAGRFGEDAVDRARTRMEEREGLVCVGGTWQLTDRSTNE